MRSSTASHLSETVFVFTVVVNEIRDLLLSESTDSLQPIL